MYVLPRGGHASQDSTGTTITFDSADVASRFAVNNWIQAGIQTANLRKVSGVGGNSITVSGAAVTVTENTRIFIIGNTQPSVTGGSATYIIPQTVIRQRDDDAADLFTNSKVTSNSDGLIQFWADAPALYDCIIQDGNQANQGLIMDLPVGAVEGISTGQASVFGATVTFNAAIGVTGWATFGSTVTMHSTMGVTGAAVFSGPLLAGASLTVNGAMGVTGSVTLGSTVTLQGNVTGISSSGSATFGTTVIFNGPTGFTGVATFGATISTTAPLISTGTKIQAKHFVCHTTQPFLNASAGWGSAAIPTLVAPASDGALSFYIGATGSGIAANPTIALVFGDGTWTEVGRLIAVTTRALNDNSAGGLSQPTIPFVQIGTAVGTSLTLQFFGTPVAGETYGCNVIIMGVSQ